MSRYISDFIVLAFSSGNTYFFAAVSIRTLTLFAFLNMPIDALQFRSVMSKFATGVTVVTTRAGEEIHGLTVNAFCSVSLQPMLVLVCIDKTATAHALLEKSKNFAVNLLAADQEEIARRFATDQLPAAERFNGVSHHRQATGAPVFDHSLGFLDCEITASYPGGDHTIFVGRVLALEEKKGRAPLLYFNSTYERLHP